MGNRGQVGWGEGGREKGEAIQIVKWEEARGERRAEGGGG